MASSSFSFEFFPSSNDIQKENAAASAAESLSSSQKKSEDAALTATSKASSPSLGNQHPHTWLSPEDPLLFETIQKQMLYVEVPLTMNNQTAGKEPHFIVRCVDTATQPNSASTTDNDIDMNETTTSFIPIWQQTDLKPRLYEGGMKIWECSMDLARYVARSDIFSAILNQNNDSSTVVLELGCGHALPSCVLLKRVVQQQRSLPETASLSSCLFYLTDYNDFVIQQATLPNVVLNLSDVSDNTQQVLDFAQNNVRMGYGNWMHLSSLENSVDVLLAAETVYTEQSAHEMALLINRHLKHTTGKAWVATKRYYFGVGGGTDAFVKACRSYHLSVEKMESFDNGSGNIRDILCVTKKAATE